VQWRTPITLVVLLVILLGAAYYGWKTVVDPNDETATPTKTTHTTKTPKPRCIQKVTYPKGRTFKAEFTKVNVFNAGGVSGLAGDVLDSLGDKGFMKGVAANPPATATATNVTIFAKDPKSPKVLLVEQQFKGKVLLVQGRELGLGVDVVIGPEFVGVDPSAPTELTLRAPTTVCARYART